MLGKYTAMNGHRTLLTVREARDLLGPDLFGRDLVYKIARKHGIRAGRRLLIPLRVVQEIKEGHIKEL